MTSPGRDPPSRDPRLDAAWRAASAEDPPEAIDSAIRAAARRAVGAGPEGEGTPRRASFRRWLPLAAVATLAAVTAGLLQLVPPEQLGAPPPGAGVVSDVPAPAAPAREATTAAAREASPPAAEARVRKELPAAPPASAANAPAQRTAPSPIDERAAPAAPALPEPFPGPRAKRIEPLDAAKKPAASPPAAPAPPLPPAAPPERPATAESNAAGAAPPSRTAASTGALATPQAARDAGATAKRSALPERSALPVDEWIALIRRLLRAGDTAEAAKQLAAFRAAHPDHATLLPPELRDWQPPAK